MTANAQVEAWNSESGRAWVEHAEHFDAMLGPFGGAVLGRLDLEAGERVLDIGCGVGATTVAIASTVAPATVIGADISAPMLAAARARASAIGIDNVEFILADVQDDDLGDGVFDVAFSRFGVMFFPDPERAFANVARSLTSGGRLGFVCFQGPFDNPMILVPVMAAAAHVEMLAPPGPNEPSPFSLADPDRISSLLVGAGFVDVAIDAGPATADVGSADDLQTTARRALEQNPGIAPGLARADPQVRAAAIAAAADALAEHVDDGRVVLAAATWVVTARA